MLEGRNALGPCGRAFHSTAGTVQGRRLSNADYNDLVRSGAERRPAHKARNAADGPDYRAACETCWGSIAASVAWDSRDRWVKRRLLARNQPTALAVETSLLIE